MIGCRVESKADGKRGNVSDIHKEAEVVRHTYVGPGVAELSIAVGGENAWAEMQIGVEPADARSTRHVEDAVEDVVRILVIVPRVGIQCWITVDRDIFVVGITEGKVSDASGRETALNVVLEGVRWRRGEAVDADGIIVG